MTPEQLREARALLIEAYEYGQFADDFDQPLAKPLRVAIRHLAEFQKLQATEREPVAWRFEFKAGEYGFCAQKDAAANADLLTSENHAIPLYAAPPDLAAKVAELESENAALRSLANNAITTLKAERDELSAQNAQLREALENHQGNYKLTKSEAAVVEAALEANNSADWLRKHDAEVLRGAAGKCLGMMKRDLLAMAAELEQKA